MALLESNFESRLSFVGESTKMELHRELSYGQPNGSQCSEDEQLWPMEMLTVLSADSRRCYKPRVVQALGLFTDF